MLEEKWLYGLLGGAVLLIVAGVLWRTWGSSMQRLERQVDHAARRTSRDETVVRRLLLQIFRLLEKPNEAQGIRHNVAAAELLQRTYGEGLIRPDETAQLFHLLMKYMAKKDWETVGVLMDCYRPLIRRLSQSGMLEALESWKVVGVLAVKEKQRYLAAKAESLLFMALERNEWNREPEVMDQALAMCSRMGVEALKKKDLDLLREILRKMCSSSSHMDEVIAGKPEIFALWLFRIVKKDDQEAFSLWCEYVDTLWRNRIWKGDGFLKPAAEWLEVAGHGIMNPYTQLPGVIGYKVLRLLREHDDLMTMENSVREVGKLSVLAITHHGIEDAFYMVRSLMECGRMLMVDEIRLGISGEEESYRRRFLQCVVEEILQVAEYGARQKMNLNGADVLKIWLQMAINDESTKGLQKSFQKFSDLILLSWQEAYPRQAKRIAGFFEGMPENADGFSEMEQKKLAYLWT